MRTITLFLLFCSPLSALAPGALPWGKDAGLTQRPRSPSSFTASAQMGKALIRFHQEVISPADGPRSHFFPSSSQYTLEAMGKHGLAKGFLYGCDRLMRENNEPWIYPKCVSPEGYTMKYDPVR